ncbi:hypothetical protein COCON_G00220250, partial [Conger conger]
MKARLRGTTTAGPSCTITTSTTCTTTTTCTPRPTPTATPTRGALRPGGGRGVPAEPRRPGRQRGGVPQVRHGPGLLPLARRPHDHDALAQLLQDAQVPQVQLALQVPADAGGPHEGEAPGLGRVLLLLQQRAEPPAPGPRRELHLRLQALPLRGVQLLHHHQGQPQHPHAVGQAPQQHADAAERQLPGPRRRAGVRARAQQRQRGARSLGDAGLRPPPTPTPPPPTPTPPPGPVRPPRGRGLRGALPHQAKKQAHVAVRGVRLRDQRGAEPAHPHDQREAHAQHGAAAAERHADAARPAGPGPALALRGRAVPVLPDPEHEPAAGPQDGPRRRGRPVPAGRLPPDPNMAALAPTLVGGELPMDMRLGGGQLVSEEMMTLGESLSQTSDPSLKLFQCAVCNRFTTDNLDVLGLHMGAERSLPEEEWRAVVGDAHQCKLCRYTTQLKANFQLHCKTDKHVQKYQLVAHIKEGGKGNEWRLKCVAIGNPVHLKCNACDYYTNSLEKLRLHTINSRHEASLKLYKHLQQNESCVEGEACCYHCALCSYSTKAKLNLVQHVRSMKHQRGESLRKLQRLQKGLPEEEELSAIFSIRKCAPDNAGELSEDVEAAGEASTDQEDQTKDGESGGEKELAKGTGASSQVDRERTDSPLPSKRPSSRSGVTESPLSSKRPRTADKSASEQLFQCPYCKYSNADVNRLRMHVMTQHSVQPMFRCPLCQDMLNNKVHLQFHLTHLHSVAPDCVDKLISSVTPSDVLPASMFVPVPGSEKDGQNLQTMTNSSSDETKKQ